MYSSLQMIKCLGFLSVVVVLWHIVLYSYIVRSVQADHQRFDRNITKPTAIADQHLESTAHNNVSHEPETQAVTLEQDNCLSQKDYQNQLFIDNKTEVRLEVDQSVDRPPFLPDRHWKLCAQQEYKFEYRISQADFCTRNKPATNLVFILSSPYENGRREKMRRYWRPAYINQGIANVFLIGKLTGLPEVEREGKQKLIDEENQRFNDIVQADFVDSYANLTYKTLMGFDWVKRYCPQAKYIFKMDDDEPWGDILSLVNVIHSRNDTDSIVCSKMYNNKPVKRRNSKWLPTYTEYPENTYPDYCRGGRGGYAMTMSVLKRLIDMSHQTRFFWIEDVFITGILRVKLGNVSAIQVSTNQTQV